MSIASANDREVTAPLHYWQCPSCHKSQQDSVAAYVGDDALFWIGTRTTLKKDVVALLRQLHAKCGCLQRKIARSCEICSVKSTIGA